MTTTTQLVTTTPPLSADIHNNELGAYLRSRWDAARADGQGHGIWRPELDRFVTMDELQQMEANQ